MDFGFIVEAMPRLLPGLWLTVQLSLLGLAIAACIGIPLGIVRSEQTAGVLKISIDAYVFLVRSTPILVQVYGAFFLLPMMGFNLDPFWIGIVALVFNSSGYLIEIARAAMRSISTDQWEGANALALRRLQILRLVIIPQAFPRMLPALANEASNLVKASSVLSVIAVFELHKSANAIISQSFKFLEMLVAQAVLYIVFVITLTQLAVWLERRSNERIGLRADFGR